MSDPFLGSIKMFGGNFAPRGYALCDGQLLSIAANTALFSLLGTTYGGNGQTTFGLPDLRGRVPVHPGTGPGLTNRILGETGGTETVTLITSQIPPHSHTPSGSAPASSLPATRTDPAGHVFAVPADGASAYASGATVPMGGSTNSGIAGGSQPHNNIQPYQCVNFIIALQGIFPSRN